jgi:hypothetical protein
MTRSQLATMIVWYGGSRAICILTVPELFHSSGRVLRADELARMPKSWLIALLAKCALVVEDFCETFGEESDHSREELIASVSISLNQISPDFVSDPLNGSTPPSESFLSDETVNVKSLIDLSDRVLKRLEDKDDG